jgi:hypothetical protein
MNPEEYENEKYSRGCIHVTITFEVSSGDYPNEVGKNIEAFINSSLAKKDFPYGNMDIDEIDVDTSECEYSDWDYEDRINYHEDCRDSRKLGE